MKLFTTPLSLVVLLGSTLCYSGLPPTTSKDSADSTNITTFFYQFPHFTGTHTGVTFSLGNLDLTSGVANILPYANGGTNAGTAWTLGSIPFFGASALSQDNAKLFWNDTNFELGIGTASPGANLQINATAIGTKEVIIKGIASQTADPFEIQASGGAVMDNISAAGNVGIANAAATAGIGLNYALPVASSAATTGLGINETGVVFPATTQVQSISLTSDTTAYSAQFGNLVGVNVNLTNSKPDTTNNGSVQTSGLSAVVTNSAAINTAATNTSYGTYGSAGEAIESGAVSGSTSGASFFNYGGEFVAAATATFSTANSNSIVNRGVSAITENTVSSKATAGSTTVTDIGVLGEVIGSTGSFSASTGYGVYASSTGDTTNYDFYAASGNPSYFSGNVVINSSLILNGSTSGTFTQSAANTTTSYSIKWPSAQGAASTFLKNDGSGNLSWGAVSASVLSQGTITTFTSSGTFTTPSNSSTSTIYKYTIVGGGGGGGGCNPGPATQCIAAGGGSGASAIGTFTSVAASTGITITVGSGGAGGAVTSGNGTSSTIGSPVSVTSGGGVGGGQTNDSTGEAEIIGGAGGSVTGSPNIAANGGSPGERGFMVYGVISPQSGRGGGSIFSGAGQGSIGNTAGGAATGYGSGGGGAGSIASNTNNGGAGAGGIVIIEQLTP